MTLPPEPAISRAQASLARAAISSWCVAHPIGTTLLTIGLILLGIVAYPMLSVAPIPEVDLPTIEVSASLPGASPETMASSVATPLEVQLSGVPGIREMTSSSSLGRMSITLLFDLDKDVDVAAQEVQAAINAASGRLPAELPSLPSWRKSNPNDSPILGLRMQSDVMTLTALSDIAETSVARQLSQIGGVSEVNIYGQRKPALRVQASPEKLASLGLTFGDLRQIIQSASVNRAKGAIYGEGRVSTLATNDQIFRPGDYDNLVVSYRQGAPVFLRDVAKVSLGAENDYIASWQNGKPGVYIMVRRQPGANIVATADAVQAALPAIRERLPASVELAVLNDRTRTIRSSLHEVQLTLAVTFVLVILVMGAFLRQLSATIIVACVLTVAL
ncbi:MAG TPA: efflux RND transporter permease subunit, partial [Steroidobacter sp.]